MYQSVRMKAGALRRVVHKLQAAAGGMGVRDIHLCGFLTKQVPGR